MSTNKQERIKLSSSSANYIPWRRYIETKIAQDGLSRHLKFPTCKHFVASDDYLKDDLEKQYEVDMAAAFEAIAEDFNLGKIADEDEARRHDGNRDSSDFGW